MRASIKWIAVVAVVLVELWWALESRNLSLPRSKETVEAIHAYQTSPSVEKKAAMFEQMQRDVSRNVRHGQIWFASMLAADALAIYFLWNHGVGKIARPPNASTAASDPKC